MIAALALLAAPLFQSASPASPPRGERESLEDVLERLRRSEALQLAALRTDVEAGIARLSEVLDAERPAGLAEARGRLVALGPRVAPLLVARIEPGAGADEQAKLLARTLAFVLAELPTPAITRELLEIAKTGTVEGRINAVRVMAVSPEPARVDPVLARLYQTATGPLRAAALAAMARIGGEANLEALGRALSSDDPALVAVALQALAHAKSAAAGSEVLALTRSRARAAPNIAAIAAYYTACPDVLREPHAAALLALAADPGIPAAERVSLVDLLAAHADRIDADGKKALRSLADSPQKELRESALVCLTIQGDRTARRELLDEHDRQVERNPNWAKGYENRAHVLYRVGDYREAIRDYKEALRIGPGDLRSQQEEVHVGLARCYAMSGKLKEAALTLRRAPLASKELRALASDPAFEKLKDNAKYGDVFGDERP